MPTTGHFSGTLLNIIVNGEIVGCQRDSSLEEQFETIDATCKDDGGARKSLPGQLSWSATMDAVTVYDAENGITQLRAIMRAKQLCSVSFTTGIPGDPIQTGQAYITGLTENAPMNDVATYSITFTGDGLLSQNTVPIPG